MEQEGGVVESKPIPGQPVAAKRFVGGGKKMLKNMPTGSEKKNTLLLVVVSIVVVSAGIASGWFLSGSGSLISGGGSGSASSTAVRDEDSDSSGYLDETVKYEEVEGMLVEGGIENEGTHHLEREGGPTKNVYLTSTVIDLQSFVGKKVKVWGETTSGQAAGWLMDVAKIKELD